MSLVAIITIVTLVALEAVVIGLTGYNTPRHDLKRVSITQLTVFAVGTMSCSYASLWSVRDQVQWFDTSGIYWFGVGHIVFGLLVSGFRIHHWMLRVKPA